jgi:hypothetical protein
MITALGSMFGLAVLVGIVVLCWWPLWRIFTKAGYFGMTSLLLLVPLVNIVAVWYFALTDWPIENELSRLRRQAGGQTA